MPEEVIPTGPEAERTEDGLVRVKTPSRAKAAVFVKPPRPHLNRYDRMVLAPIVIAYKRGGASFSDHDEELLRASFRESLLESIDSGPAWKRVESGGEGVLLARVSVVDVEIQPPAVAAASQLNYRASGGGVVLVLEFFDSTTKEPLFRFMEKHRLPGGVYAGGAFDRRRVTAAFDDFAEAIGRNLRNQYRIIREIERREAEAGEG